MLHFSLSFLRKKVKIINNKIIENNIAPQMFNDVLSQITNSLISKGVLVNLQPIYKSIYRLTPICFLNTVSFTMNPVDYVAAKGCCISLMVAGSLPLGYKTNGEHH